MMKIGFIIFWAFCMLLFTGNLISVLLHQKKNKSYKPPILDVLEQRLGIRIPARAFPLIIFIALLLAFIPLAIHLYLTR